MVALIQTWIFAALAVVLFAVQVWAFVNALRFRPDAYLAAGKRTKRFWLLLTGLSMLLGFLSLPTPIGGSSATPLLMIIGIVIAGVFLTDVLPALRTVMENSRRNRW